MSRCSCYNHMRRIRWVRTSRIHRRYVHVAFVLGRIDDCNSLYAGCTHTVLQGLQRAQSTAARLLTGTVRLKSALAAHAGSSLSSLSSRIQYKLCTLMYEVVHGTVPGYLIDLCHPCRDVRLRSGSRADYVVPFSPWHKSCSVFPAQLRAWNSLPSNVRDATFRIVFANILETHLFKLIILDMYNV